MLRIWVDDVLVHETTDHDLSLFDGGFTIDSNWSGSDGMRIHDTTNYLFFDEVEIYTDTGTGASGSMSAGTVTQGGSSDTTAPTVSLTAPANGATGSGNTTVSATASDNVGVIGVQFKLDGTNLGTEDTTSPFSITWNTTQTTNGSHTLTAVARDAAGNSTTATSRTVTVSNAATAPTITNVSGSIVDGQSVTISGSGFGIKATAKPLVFDTFDSGTNGTDIVGRPPVMTALNAGNWTWEGTAAGGSATPKYSTSNQRPGSSASALADMDGVQWNNSLSIVTQQPEYFASWWVYYDHYAGSVSRNTKPWVMYGSSNEEPHAYSGWGDLSDSSLRSSIADSGYSDPNTAYGSPQTPNFYGKWIKFELYLKQSSPGVANGTYKVWITEPGQPTYLSLNRDSVQTRGINAVWQQFTFVGAYCDSDPSNRKYRIYADDFYYDNTRARVELGNAATYAATTIREVQPANAWSALSATIAVHKGSFTSGQTAYLYVVDSTGAVNASGYPVTVGGTTDTTPPTAPTGLVVP